MKKLRFLLGLFIPLVFLGGLFFPSARGVLAQEGNNSAQSLSQEIPKDFLVSENTGLLPETQPSTPPKKSAPSREQIIGAELQRLEQELKEFVPNRQGVLPLSFNDAIKLAILNNLKTLIANEKVYEAKGTFQQSLSGMLPQVDGKAFQLRRTSNFLSAGLDPSTFPGFPTGVFGPFNTFDARVYLVQQIFNFAAISEMQSGRSNLRLSRLQVELAKHQVFQNAGLAYVQAQQTLGDVKAAQADYTLSTTLYKLTKVAFDAGVVTGIDLARAEAKMLEGETQLLQAKTNAAKAELDLKGILLLPMGTPLRLTSPLLATPTRTPSVETALKMADANRPDIKVSREHIRLAGYQHRVAIGKQIPSLGFAANYGGSGSTPTQGTAGTYQIAGQLQIPIFDGGNTLGSMSVTKSKKRQAILSLGNLLEQSDKEVRIALMTLKFTAMEIVSTTKNLEVAKREMTLARERFFTGVGDNLEVVQAQTTLAEARNAQVQALARYHSARVQLAVAIGKIDSFHFNY